MEIGVRPRFSLVLLASLGLPPSLVLGYHGSHHTVGNRNDHSGAETEFAGSAGARGSSCRAANSRCADPTAQGRNAPARRPGPARRGGACDGSGQRPAVDEGDSGGGACRAPRSQEPRRCMRLVVDTNVLVSAFLWQSTPGRLIELASEKEVELFTSRTLLDQLAATLAKKKLAKPALATGLTADQMLH